MGLLAALTVKVSAILLLTLMAALCLRRTSASARRWVLAVGVVSAIAAPALHVLPILPVRVARVEPLVFDALLPRPDVPFTEPAVAAVASDDLVGRFVVAVWLAGAVAGVGVLLVGLARLRRLRSSSRRVTEGPWHRLCTDLARSCGLKRGVDLLLGPSPGLVATWGWRRPAVMLPASARDWSAERMRIVLLHELAHVRRGDWMLQMAAEALRCVWWFNPLAWMVRARLRRESEHAADDLVLARGVPAATCATHLVELARDVRKHRRTWLPAPAMARPSHLERRLSAMLNPRTNRRPMTRLARLGSLGVLALVSLLVTSLQVGPVSAAPFAESTGGAVEQEPPAAPSSERREALVAAVVAVDEAAAASRSESPGGAVEQEPSAELSSERLAALAAAVAAAVEAAASRSAESPGSAVATEPPAEPLSARRAALVAAVAAALEAAAASRSGESPGNAVEQEPSAARSSERLAELVARAAALQEQLQSVLNELQSALGDSDRSTGSSGEPFRIGDGIRPPARIGGAAPVYPSEAREARAEGVVIMQATISPTGEVSDVEVLRSAVPLLDEAAVAAVRQWRYEPTLVDGEPVSIVMTVTVNFALRDDGERP